MTITCLVNNFPIKLLHQQTLSEFPENVLHSSEEKTFISVVIQAYVGRNSCNRLSRKIPILRDIHFILYSRKEDNVRSIA